MKSFNIVLDSLDSSEGMDLILSSVSVVETSDKDVLVVCDTNLKVIQSNFCDNLEVIDFLSKYSDGSLLESLATRRKKETVEEVFDYVFNLCKIDYSKINYRQISILD